MYVNDVVSVNAIVNEYEIVDNFEINDTRSLNLNIMKKVKKSLIIGKITNWDFDNTNSKKIKFNISFKLPFVKKSISYSNEINIKGTSKRKEIQIKKIIIEEYNRNKKE